jgi:hypothetical protein
MSSFNTSEKQISNILHVRNDGWALFLTISQNLFKLGYSPNVFLNKRIQFSIESLNI